MSVCPKTRLNYDCDDCEECEYHAFGFQGLYCAYEEMIESGKVNPNEE